LLDQIDFIIETKLEAVKRIIAEQQENNILPILGYSYFEYANELKEDNDFSALLYAEYSLELSNLDIYFSKKEFSLPRFDFEKIGLFLGGVVLGAVVILLVKRKKKSKKKNK